jgi:hypothetical protein
VFEPSWLARRTTSLADLLGSCARCRSNPQNSKADLELIHALVLVIGSYVSGFATESARTLLAVSSWSRHVICCQLACYIYFKKVA